MPGPSFGELENQQAMGNSNYNALQVSLLRRFTNHSTMRRKSWRITRAFAQWTRSKRLAALENRANRNADLVNQHSADLLAAHYLTGTGTLAFSTRPRSRTMATVSSSASVKRSNIRSISDSEMINGGQKAMESPIGRRMTPW